MGHLHQTIKFGIFNGGVLYINGCVIGINEYSLFKIKGIRVPNKAANNITVNRDRLTVNVSVNESLNKKLYININAASINPFNNATKNSLSNFCPVLSNPSEFAAIPCTIIDED